MQLLLKFSLLSPTTVVNHDKWKFQMCHVQGDVSCNPTLRMNNHKKNVKQIFQFTYGLTVCFSGWLWQTRASNRFATNWPSMGRSNNFAFSFCSRGMISCPPERQCYFPCDCCLTCIKHSLFSQELCGESKKQPESFYDVLKAKWGHISPFSFLFFSSSVASSEYSSE